ncbi:MAG: alpha/beta fold hydrolase [Solirubrobacterales bacterium]
MDRPRLLLVPEFTELEWAIKPRLEDWADVASYDPPGIGGEPRAETLDRDAVAARGVDELDRRGWERCFIASDGWGIATAVRLALSRPGAVAGMALGHAKLSYRRDGERAPVNGEVWAGMRELIGRDHEAFIRHGAAQVTGGSIDEEQAERMIERFPRDLLTTDAWETLTRDDVQIGELLGRLDCPLLFAKHDGCLMSTEEGFDDAAAAFPEAHTISVTEAPLASEAFSGALREFCEGRSVGLIP